LFCFTQTLFTTKVEYASNDILNLEYVKNNESDRIVFNNDIFLIERKVSKNQLIFSVYQKDEKIYDYVIEKPSFDTLLVLRYSLKKKEICQLSKSLIYFDSDVSCFYDKIDYLFISNLIHYEYYLPTTCEVSNFPSTDLFSFASEKKFGNIYRKITTEIDSMFVYKDNKPILMDYQKYKKKKGVAVQAEGYYYNSFDEIVNVVTPFLKTKVSLLGKRTRVVGKNLLNNSRFKYEMKNLYPVTKTIVSKSRFGKEKVEVTCNYPTEIKSVCKTVINGKFEKLTTQKINF